MSLINLKSESEFKCDKCDENFEKFSQLKIHKQFQHMKTSFTQTEGKLKISSTQTDAAVKLIKLRKRKSLQTKLVEQHLLQVVRKTFRSIQKLKNLEFKDHFSNLTFLLLLLTFPQIVPSQTF